MQPKDYYKILNVSPGAGEQEIRKAFRSLAQTYHPDKNNGDASKEAIFREVQEAYEILSDSKSREEYNYKRWYTRSIGKSFREQPVSPDQIWAESRRLSEYLASVNNLHVDYDILSHRIRSILSPENIAILIHFNNVPLNERIVRSLLESATTLPARYLDPICLLLAKVAGNDPLLLSEIKSYSEERINREFWQKHTGWLVILVTFLICWLMYIYAS